MAKQGKSESQKPDADDALADDTSNGLRPFDVRTIRQLVGMMSQNDLSEIDLRQGSSRVRLLRGPRVVASAAMPILPAPVQAAASPAPAAPPAAPPASAEPAKPTKKLIDIKSPTVGTFYSAPKPDAEPFVRKGSRVTNDTVVCTIEAMKIFNEITADCAGVVAEVLAENQQFVEFGQVLFRVDPAG